MTLAVEAVFEDEDLKPVSSRELEEHRKVHLIVQTRTVVQNFVPTPWHWQEAQAIDDGFGVAVGDEVTRQRREG